MFMTLSFKAIENYFSKFSEDVFHHLKSIFNCTLLLKDIIFFFNNKFKKITMQQQMQIVTND